MSIALERNGSGGDHRIERPGIVHRNMAFVSPIYNSDRSDDSLSSSSTSSIGKNSDDESSGDDEEVQSECKRGPLDSLNALEEVLPVKKSISKFYSGKSKSFTSLSDASSCSAIEDITKPENAYTKKRKNLLASNNLWDKNHTGIRSSSGGISKRSSNSRSMLSLASTMNCSESNSGEASNANSKSSSPNFHLPPLPPHSRKPMHSELSSSPPVDKLPSWRSFSLSDLQSAATAGAASPSIIG